MNLPNKLSLSRILLVPVCVVFMAGSFLPGCWNPIIAAIVFAVASFTDFLDGKIARKNNLVTDFGKFIDPLADKFLVISALVVLSYKLAGEGIYGLLVLIAALIVVFRELAVTSMRLVVSGKSGIVVAASWYGKVKTVSQIFFVLSALLEPVIFAESFAKMHIIAYFWMAVMSVMTVLSGYEYLKTYWKYIKE